MTYISRMQVYMEKSNYDAALIELDRVIDLDNTEPFEEILGD